MKIIIVNVKMISFFRLIHIAFSMNMAIWTDCHYLIWYLTVVVLVLGVCPVRVIQSWIRLVLLM